MAAQAFVSPFASAAAAAPCEPPPSVEEEDNTLGSAAPATPARPASMRALSGASSGDSVARRSGSNLWQAASGTLLPSISLSRRFSTLRDMFGTNLIDPARLTRVRDLGEGAYATVEQARLAGEDGAGCARLVAVKRLKPHVLSSPAELDSFGKEVALLRKLRHPAIVEFIGVGTAPMASGKGAAVEAPFLVQEFCDGGSLRALLQEQMLRPGQVVFSHADALRWALQVAGGLAYLHDAQPLVIHRDLKLDNVLLAGPKGKRNARLVDFGLHAVVEARNRLAHTTSTSKRVREQMMNLSQGKLHASDLDSDVAKAASRVEQSMAQAPARSFSRAASRSASGKHLPEPTYRLTGHTGSYMYMAPEVCMGEPYNEKVDVFSFGVIVYELFLKMQTLVFILQYAEGTAEECQIYAHKVAGGYRRALPAHWPPELQKLIGDCWAQEPQARPAMREVVSRLEAMAAAGVAQAMDEQAAARLGCACVLM